MLVYDIDRCESFSSALRAPRNALAVQEVPTVDILRHGIFLGVADVNDNGPGAEAAASFVCDTCGADASDEPRLCDGNFPACSHVGFTEGGTHWGRH